MRLRFIPKDLSNHHRGHALDIHVVVANNPGSRITWECKTNYDCRYFFCC